MILQILCKPQMCKIINIKHLENTTDVLQNSMKQQLKGKTVTLVEGSWSSVCNEHVTATCLQKDITSFF